MLYKQSQVSDKRNHNYLHVDIAFIHILSYQQLLAHFLLIFSLSLS